MDLRLLSPGMARRQANSTAFLRHRQLLAWHVEWRFAGTSCPCLTDRSGSLFFYISSPFLEGISQGACTGSC